MKEFTTGEILKSIIKFFFKHIVLFIIFYCFIYFIFDKVLFIILKNKLFFLRSYGINSTTAATFIISLITLIFKLIIYGKTTENDKNDVTTTPNLHLAYIVERFFNGLFSLILFSCAVLLSSLFFILPGIYVFSLYCYTIVFSTSKEPPNTHSLSKDHPTYFGTSAFARTDEIIVKRKKKLIFYNIMAFSIFLFCYFLIQNNIYIHNINVSFILKNITIDCLLIYLIKTTLFLDDYEENEFENIKSKETVDRATIEKSSTMFNQKSKQKTGNNYTFFDPQANVTKTKIK